MPAFPTLTETSKSETELAAVCGDLFHQMRQQDMRGIEDPAFPILISRQSAGLLYLLLCHAGYPPAFTNHITRPNIHHLVHGHN